MSKNVKRIITAIVVITILLLTIAYLNSNETHNGCKLEMSYIESVGEESSVETEYLCTCQIGNCYYEENWSYRKYATPFEKGERYKKCSFCGNILVEEYTMAMAGDNSIYIPGTGINNCFEISSFTQVAIDNYDIIYTERTGAGTNNPFIIGHNYGTLGKLDQSEVGRNIYIAVNGTIETYRIVISEYGLQNESWTDIVGQSTGTSIWHNYDCKTLHIYTCYGNQFDGRWIVLATLVS